jgi:hypothetical protein
MSEFVPFGKLARLYKHVIITEKIDGTNAGIRIEPTMPDELPLGALGLETHGTYCAVFAQSRNRTLPMGPTRFSEGPEDWKRKDNHNFAQWVSANVVGLAETLGPGVHFGEWWGMGIQRTYDLGERRFSLFNTKRWLTEDLSAVPGLDVVPVVAQGDFSDQLVESALFNLSEHGSLAAPGYTNPEGVVVYHTAANMMFKVPFDPTPKGAR